MRKDILTAIVVISFSLLFFKGGGSVPVSETCASSGDAGKGNALKHSLSPYLLQHADNPVDWMEWGDKAFERARSEGKPIFLSIGYSTCHWCHVMSHESFSDRRIAAIMNKYFVCVKVDREARPDVDSVYMRAVQVMTGSGGWPLSVFITADGKPFYGGTYFPPTDGYGRPSFEKVLIAIADAWTNDREKLLNSAGKLSELISIEPESQSGVKLSADMLDTASKKLSSVFDSVNGGFGRAPKFPQPSNLSMLLTHYYRTGDKDALKMVETTLMKMSQGGMYDQLGGGFHRYSTDEEWLVPHFEKMLYDQALISRSLLQAYQLTGDEKYAKIAREVFDYVLRDMVDEQGGFYTAEDADSEGEEGTFYVWGKGEIDKLLGDDDAKIFNRYYGVSDAGNFEGKNILHVAADLDEVVGELSMSKEKVSDVLKKGKKKLFDARAKRVRPHRDEKIISGWNGLMIASFAQAGRVLGENKYTEAAGKSADFVLSRLVVDGRLKRYYAGKMSDHDGVLDDYAFMILGLTELYQSDYNPRWLVEAKKLSFSMIELFFDTGDGGFYITGSDSEHLLYRGKDVYDGAIPSGNSVAAEALLKLGHLTMDKQLLAAAEKTLQLFSGRLADGFGDLSEMLMAVDIFAGPRQEIVIAGTRGERNTDKMLDVVRKAFLPRAAVLLHGNDIRIEQVAGFIRPQVMIAGKPTAYFCENYACQEPMTDITKVKELIDQLTGRNVDAESRTIAE
ncbi:MAG: thioredoxin domain-containing protein [Anaerohalosphaera sp.]|nr:thioredoxin domain-containing protein [Anaerohalosphaera sp.]